MEKYNFIIAMVIILGVCGAGYVFAYLKKKGVNVSTGIKEAGVIIEDAGTIIKAGKSLEPNNKILNVLDIIDTLAEKAVKAVEQLYISSQLSADQRKIKAKEIIQAGLKFAEIKETTEIDTLIDAAIEQIIVGAKSETEKKSQEQNTLQAQINQLNTEKAQLQASNSELANKNGELINKLTSIQSVVK
ncbi:hypothetical protein NL50_17290 [Clostridium acetobutylicum]|nr:hypothetical protein NL50_17290 [Clostridium acetobutylicum]